MKGCWKLRILITFENLSIKAFRIIIILMKGSGRLDSEGNKPIVVLDIDISAPIDVKKAIE